MSTTVTIKTYDWPVEVTSQGFYADKDGNYSNSTSTRQRVKPQSEQQFSVTQNNSLTVVELQRPSPDA